MMIMDDHGDSFRISYYQQLQHCFGALYAAQERKNECVQSVDKDHTQLKRICLIHQIGCQI